MRITYDKEVQGDSLKPFITLQEPKLSEVLLGDRAYVKSVLYHLSQLEQRLIDDLTEVIGAKGFKFIRTESNGLWVSEPYQVYLSHTAHIKRSHSSERKREVQNLQREDLKKVGEQRDTTRGGSTRVLPIYEEIPAPVLVNGVAAYESLGAIKPEPLLETLAEKGFNSHVITTPEELTDAIERARRASSRMGYTAITHRQEGGFDMASAMVGFVAGALISDSGT